MIRAADMCPELCSDGDSRQDEQQTVTVTRLVGVTNHPKSRVCMEVLRWIVC